MTGEPQAESLIGPSYSLRLYRTVPETRRFRRWILRRQTRNQLVFAGIPTGFSWDRHLNGGERLSVTAEEPTLFFLSRMEG